MKSNSLLALGIIMLATAPAINATDFFSTEEPSQFLTFGARLGVNTTNRTLGDKAFPDCYHRENWGAGLEVGVVADLNIRDYLAIQPGVFFETRSGSYTLMGTQLNSGLPDDGSSIAEAGTRHSCNLTIPVLASFRFNITDDLRWSIDAGPYVQFAFGSGVKTKALVIDGPASEPMFGQKPASFDFGVKMGSGLQFLEHYYVGIHYEAGCLHAWKDQNMATPGLTKKYGGVAKGWTFTLGYDF